MQYHRFSKIASKITPITQRRKLQRKSFKQTSTPLSQAMQKFGNTLIQSRQNNKQFLKDDLEKSFSQNKSNINYSQFAKRIHQKLSLQSLLDTYSLQIESIEVKMVELIEREEQNQGLCPSDQYILHGLFYSFAVESKKHPFKQDKLDLQNRVRSGNRLQNLTQYSQRETNTLTQKLPRFSFLKSPHLKCLLQDFEFAKKLWLLVKLQRMLCPKIVCDSRCVSQSHVKALQQLYNRLNQSEKQIKTKDLLLLLTQFSKQAFCILATDKIHQSCFI